MRPTERAAITGREVELAHVELLLIGGRERFTALLVEGEAGIGKTTIFREALARAEESGFRVLACRPGPAEAMLSLQAIGDLLQAVPAEPFAALPPPQRRALEVALLRAEPGEHVPDQRTVAVAVRSLLARLAAEGPVLVAIDDVQWLDAGSAAVLGFVLRRLGPEHVGLLATRRLSERAPLDVRALVPPEALVRERLGPLSLGALQHLLRERIGSSLPRSTLVRVHATAGGNPFFALEIARVLAERGTPRAGEPLPVPDDVRELVRERVAALPQSTRDLLLAAALVAQPSVATMREVFGQPPDVELEPAEQAGIAAFEGDVVVFAHPLHAAAVVATATEAERRRMHRRLADSVRGLEERASHLASAADGPDGATASLLEAAARAARARGGLHAAAEFLERARALTPPREAERARARGLRAAELHLHAGDHLRARTLLEELLGGPLAPTNRAEALRVLAGLSLVEENVPEAERLLLEALPLADDPGLRARIQLELCYVVGASFDFARGADFARQALTLLESSDDGPLLAEAFAYCAMGDYLVGRGVDWEKVERALALEDPTRLALPGLPPRGVAACLLMYVGRHAEARELMEQTCARLTERGEEKDLAHALLWLSWLETRCGNFATAARLADEAIMFASLTGNRTIERWATAQRGWVDAHLGDVAAARRRAAEALAEGERGALHVQHWAAATVSLLELSLRDYAAAWEACKAASAAVERNGVGEPVPLIFLPDALEALVGIGELDRAERLLDGFERRAHELDRVWALATAGRCRGLLILARGDVRGALSALDGALAEHARIDLPFERARTLFVKGSIERRARRRARAQEALAEALSEFERMGAALWAERARAELARVGQREASGTALTPAERRVADLVAEGFSNKEVAQRLFVSVHTVEVHLSHVYAKLGLRSRTQLAGRLRPEPNATTKV